MRSKLLEQSLSLGLGLDLGLVSGRIDVGEIQHLLHKLGVEVTTEQASRILQRCACVRLSGCDGCCCVKCLSALLITSVITSVLPICIVYWTFRRHILCLTVIRLIFDLEVSRHKCTTGDEATA